MVTPILLPSTAFDPATVRLSQNFHETLGVKKAVVTVPVRKPARQEFIRVHADPAFRLETAILNLKEQREIYLAALASEITPMVLVTVVNRQKMGSLWPIRLAHTGVSMPGIPRLCGLQRWRKRTGRASWPT